MRLEAGQSIMGNTFQKFYHPYPPLFSESKVLLTVSVVLYHIMHLIPFLNLEQILFWMEGHKSFINVSLKYF